MGKEMIKFLNTRLGSAIILAIILLLGDFILFKLAGLL